MSPRRKKRRYLPSPALVVGTLALVIALGSAALAVVPAAEISGTKIKKRSEPGNRFVPDSVTGAEVKESKLGTLPSAATADTAATATHATSATSATNAANAGTVGGLSAAKLTLQCPANTLRVGGACVETGPARAAQAYIGASQTCGALGRTLPTAAQLTAFSFFVLGAGPEIASDLESTGAAPVFITVDTSTLAQSQTAAATAFRCVIPLTNR
jgi:hypothetical protein